MGKVHILNVVTLVMFTCSFFALVYAGYQGDLNIFLYFSIAWLGALLLSPRHHGWLVHRLHHIFEGHLWCGWLLVAILPILIYAFFVIFHNTIDTIQTRIRQYSR